ncbi:MAG TPA: cellulase family glycosylhydrolase [Ktedonobacteraceae bacterium]|nr:cellulase family glycosylhydrolase [Ktedonobacteraceae bacterium]
MKTKARRSRFPFIISFLIICLLVIGSLIAVRVVRLIPPAITGLHISGNQLVNGSNVAIIPHGVNRSGTEYMCVQGNGFFDGPSNAASVDAMASWHINTVRVPLNEDCWLGINGSPSEYSGPAYQKAIIDYVHLLNSKNIIAILDLHWSAPGVTLATKQLAMPDADHSPAFWTSVATTFKGNSSVIFDLFNEPFPDTWDCWLQGSSAPLTAPCDKIDFAVAGMQTLVNTVRATGANNVLITSGLGYADYLKDWTENKPQDPDHNVMAAFHAYNFAQCSSVSCLQENIQPILATAPVIVAELGENDCQQGYVDKTMDWLDKMHVGYLGWSWNVADCKKFPALINSYNGTPTAFGAGLKARFSDLAFNPFNATALGYISGPMFANITSSSSESLRKLFPGITW